jgi:CBS domain-containing protein
MPKVKDIMTKGCEWIAPDAPIKQAAKIMKNKDIGFLPVGENDRMIGMITDRDIVIRAVAAGKDPAKAQVRDVMTAKTFYCFDDQDVEEICNNLGEIKVRRLPVVNRDKRLVGVISVGDLAQAASRANIGQTEQQITACVLDRKKKKAA